MRCKRHVADQSSTFGVCASCLRERLEDLREAQGDAQAQTQTNSERDSSRTAAPLSSNSRKPGPEPEPHPPHVSHKKSNRRLDRRFYSTPPADSSAVCDGGPASSKTRHGRFWNLFKFFRFKSKNPESSSRKTSDPPPSSSAPVSPSNIPAILVVEGTNHDAADGASGIKNPKSDRGTDNAKNEFGGRDRSNSQVSPPEYSPRHRNLTAEVSPRSVRRSRTGSARKTARNLAFCLSPLVRATPNRQWSHKGFLGQELSGPRPGPGPAHTHSLFANRSRKLADFGRGCRHR